MLDPNNRQLLLDALRPEPGVAFDAGVGTSFTLNLDALLLAPLAFALFGTDDASHDPIALLAAIQQHASKLALYCDRSHITTKPSEQKLLVLLEPTIKPVAAPGEGAFHPKLWALRFRRRDGSLAHRLLVLSRNLAFDTSWDLIVSLDESPDGGLPGEQVAEFLTDLDRLSPSPITKDVARSIRSVRFDLPEPFDDGRLHSFGLARSSPDVIGQASGSRGLVVSPFLTAPRLSDLQGLGRNRTLVSTPHELERLGETGVEGWGTPLTLSENADAEDGEPTGLRGLHAKLYVTDDGDRSTWFVGSANATGSATGRNVETVLELHGPKRKVGVGALLTTAGSGVQFAHLLEEFQIVGVEPRPMTAEEEDEERLEELAAKICAGEFQITVAPTGSGFRLFLRRDGDLIDLGPGDELYARPVTRKTSRQVDLGGGVIAELEVATASEITSLVAFQLKSGRKTTEPRLFVVQAELIGAPEDRVDRLLVELIPDKRRFALLLFLLLAAEDSEADIAARARHLLEGQTDGNGNDGALGIPLYEALVRASAREPEKLVAVDKLVTQLCKTEEGASRLPDGFAGMWECFQPLVKKAAR